MGRLCPSVVFKKAHILITEALEFFKDTVLPIERKCGFPSEPMTIYAPSVSINYELSTVSNLQFVDESINTKSSDELAKDAIEERERRKEDYEMNCQSRLQPNIIPKVDESLVGFNIEVCFEHPFVKIESRRLLLD
jgi:hypothetical protein